jgi:hypothetical protein
MIHILAENMAPASSDKCGIKHLVYSASANTDKQIEWLEPDSENISARTEERK